MGGAGRRTKCKACSYECLHSGEDKVSITYYCIGCGKPHSVGKYSLFMRDGDPGKCSSCKSALSDDPTYYKCACGSADFEESWYLWD